VWPMRGCQGVCEARSAGKFLRLRPWHENVQLLAVARDDASRFLAAMLKSIEAEVGEVGGFGWPKTPKTPHSSWNDRRRRRAFDHLVVRVRSSEWAPGVAERFNGTVDHRAPLCSMRNEPSR